MLLSIKKKNCKFFPHKLLYLQESIPLFKFHGMSFDYIHDVFKCKNPDSYIFFFKKVNFSL